MVFDIFRKVIDETTMEVNDSYRGTIDKLVLQRGKCSVIDCNQVPLRFDCSEKGDIKVWNHRRQRSDRYRIYYVVGKVLSENNKTVVKICSIESRAMMFSFAVSIALTVIMLVLSLVVILSFGLKTAALAVVAVVALCVADIIIALSYFNQIKNKDADLALMKNEVVKRVKAIEHWDD